MNKLLYCIALAAVLSSCSRFDETQDEGITPDIDVALKDNQVLCGIPLTKTALDQDLNVVWSEDDEITVFDGEKAVTYRFSSWPLEDDRSTAVFECTGAGAAGIGPRCAIYPASAYIEDSYDGNTASLSVGGVTEVGMPAGNASEVLSKDTGISMLPLIAVPSEETLTFDNLFGGVMLRPYDHAGMGLKINRVTVKSNDGKAIAGTATVDMETGKLISFTGTQTVLTYNCDATDISAAGKGFIAWLPAGEYSDGITVTAIDDTGREFPVSTGAVTISPGKVKRLPELPLSTFYGSANSIHVKTGVTSVTLDVTPKYTWKSDYSASGGRPIRVMDGNLSRFGKDVKVIWQQKENSTSSDLTGSSAVPGAIISAIPETVTFNDAEGTASVTISLTGDAGNAVVAICNGDETAWSYHIWVSDAADITIGDRTFHDRNLGAVSVTAGDRDSYGLCYQWGRKDPFPRILTDADSDVSGYKSKGDLLKTVNKATGGTVAYSVRNPDTRITSAKSITCKDGDHWFSSGPDIALWGCGESYTSSSDAGTYGTSIKTIYDPCPEGYKVPTYGDLTSLLAGSIGTAEKKGRTIDGNYFPFGGFIRLEESFTSGGQTGWMTDTRGYLWSSIRRNGNGNEQGAYLLKYNKDHFNNHNSSATDANGTGRGDQIYGFLGDACPVRCIKEVSSGTGDVQDPPALEEGEVRLNTAMDMNSGPTVSNSHAGLEAYSVLQPMHNNILKLENSVLTAGIPSEQQKAHYPRLKRLKDGGVILFYQGGSQSSRIFTLTSSSFNGLKTAKPELILTPYQDVLEGVTVWQRYMNMDAVVMPDGEIIAVAQHHAWDNREVGYYQNLGTALFLMRSTDGGKTWTEPKEIYSEASWEPYLLLLPDGTLHMYFTDSNPFIYSSQTSVMTSSDKGQTWSEKKVIARQYKYPYDGSNTEYHGQNVYTDQMPCFRLLNDGKTLIGFLEGRYETGNSLAGDYTSYHRMSLVRSSGTEWTAITGDSQNALPSLRNTSAMVGTGGYVETFPSGETLISCSSNGPFLIKMLDKDCTVSSSTWNPSDWFQPFGSIGVWGAMERYNDNILMATASDGSTGIDAGLFYLNQQQTAPVMSVTVDGDNSGWSGDKALFLSSENGTEMILRFAHDAENLYILSESCHNGTNEAISITVSNGSRSLSASLSADGTASSSDNVTIGLCKGQTSDGRKGYSMEAGIPLSMLGISSGSTVYVYAEAGGKAFTSAVSGQPSTWQRVKLH